MQELRPILEPYTRSQRNKALWQLIPTLVGYLTTWFLMWRCLSVSYWLTLLLTPIAAIFYIRMFIFFHDCGHNSFFPSTRANKAVGFWLGLLLFFPGEQWWHAHAIHHATNSNLDRRGIGDVETLTVQEFQSAPWWRRTWYRIFRNPFIMFGIGPLATFILANRVVMKDFGKKEKMSVLWTNLGLLILVVGLSLLIGIKAYLLVQLPIAMFAGSIGIWLFYIQHQFKDMYWVRNDQWDYVASALRGASYYQLPKLLQWVTGNIGFHHIHHLNPRIPNYELERCYRENRVLQEYAKTIPFGKGFTSLRLKLWDEAQQIMVGYPD